MSVAVEVFDQAGLGQVQGPVIDLVRAVLDAEGASGTVVVAFLGEQAITELNGRYLGRNEPTDVLSFRYADDAADWPGTPDLGEVAVCPDVVERYAQAEGGDPGAQLGWALVHGALHLAGYDHERDDGEMRRREQVLLRGLDHLVKAVASGADR